MDDALHVNFVTAMQARIKNIRLLIYEGDVKGARKALIVTEALISAHLYWFEERFEEQ